MEPRSAEPLVPPLKRSLLLFILFSACGVAGNYFSYEIFFNFHFFFGSIFALLVLQFLGLRWGVAAAFLISLATWKLWNHPYAIVILTAETAVAGLLMRRRNTGLLLADTLYWLFIGIPLVLLFYYGVMQQPFYSAGVSMMKQALNGIANALAAKLLYLFLAGLLRRELFSLRELLFSFLAAFALFPSLILLGIQSRTDYQRIEHSIISELAFASSHAASVLGDNLNDDMSKIVQLSRMAGTLTIPEMQHELEMLAMADRDFLRTALMDRNAVSIAHYPLLDELGESTIGKDFSDRPFLPVIRQSLKPMLSGSMTSIVGAPQAIVAMVAPVIDQGRFAGFVGGILNTSRLQMQISNSIALASLPDLQFTLVDGEGRIIMTNSAGRHQGDLFEAVAGERVEVSASGLYQLVPRLSPNTPVSDRWKRSYYVAEKPVGTLAEWKLILEQPFAPFLAELYSRYTLAMALVLLILCVSLVLAERLSRGMVISLDRLKRLSSEIPASAASGADLVWPESLILEPGELIENFRAMAKTLTRQFTAIQELNVELECRVGERTRELQESMENYRQLFEAESDAIFLIENASGRILKANQAACSMYGYDRDELLGLKNTDLSAEVEETRKVTQETEPVPDKVIAIPHRLHRKKDGTVFPVEITGRFFVYGGQPVHIAAVRDISRRTSMEQSLRESEERFRSLFEKVPVVALVIDPADGSIVNANTAATAFYGWSREQLLAMKISGINTLPPDELESAMAAASSGQRATFPFRHRRADGSIRDVEVYSGPVNIGGRMVLYSIIHDITERRQAEAEREQYYKFFRTSADLMAIADPSGAFIKVNPAFTETLGYSESELLSRPFLDFVHPEDQQATRDEMARQLRTGYTLNFENRYLRKDGYERWLSWRAIFDSAEGVTYAAARDITEQRQVAEELRRLANEQEVILNTLAIGVAHVKERRLVWSNPAFQRLFGYTKEESVVLPARQLYATDEDYERVGRGYARIAAGEIYRSEIRSVRKDGSQFWLNLSGVAVNPGQPEEGSIWIMEDISERKAMEIALHEREKFLKTIIDSEPDCIKLLAADGSLLQMNPAGLAMIGAESLAQVQGQCIYQMIVPEQREAFKKLTEEVFRGHPGTLQFEAVGLGGRRIWLETHAVPLYSDREEIIAALGITRDITVRRQEEEALKELTRTLEMRVEEEIGRRLKNEQLLVQQAKLAAMGEMLGAIAHQWRQPLNTLALCVQNINEAYIHDELDRSYLDRTVMKSMDQIRHMSKTIDDFRNFFQPDKERSVFDTVSAVREVLSLLSAQLTSNDIEIRLTCHTPAKVFEVVTDTVICPEKTVEGFRNEFEHVILNLISNAKDAIVAGRGQHGGFAAKGLITFDFINRGDLLVIEVGDNGPGIPEAILPRIFEPYFTTKEQAKGTGIGLYMSRIIIEDHMHGTLSAENRDRGALFRITLPQIETRTTS